MIIISKLSLDFNLVTAVISSSLPFSLLFSQIILDDKDQSIDRSIDRYPKVCETFRENFHPPRGECGQSEGLKNHAANDGGGRRERRWNRRRGANNGQSSLARYNTTFHY